MAIGTDASIEVFGTPDPIDDTTTSAISDHAMAAAADIAALTNTDNAAQATIILLWQYPSGTITGKIDLHIRPINIDGTNDAPIPTATDKTGYVGTFDVQTGQAVAGIPSCCAAAPIRTNAASGTSSANACRFRMHP